MLNMIAIHFVQYMLYRDDSKVIGAVTCLWWSQITDKTRKSEVVKRRKVTIEKKMFLVYSAREQSL